MQREGPRMSMTDWRSRAGTVFAPTKRPATGSRGMVVTNHPLASAAGAEMLAEGGNAVDAGIAALFALSVVEPMMVGLLGGGMAHLRLPDGTHTVLDGLSTVPAAGRADMYTPVSQDWPAALETVGRANAVGATSVATPGNLLAWCAALERHGSLPLADVMAPAIRLAARGFAVTPYLAECVVEAAADLARDPAIAALLLPGGAPIRPGARLVNGALAETLATIAAEGPGALHGGALGAIVAADIARRGGMLTAADLRDARMVTRAAVHGTYRGIDILGPPPPSSGGVHVIQMLNILEGFDLQHLGYGTAASCHLIAEALKIAFADRAAATADPDFVAVPTARLLSKSYAASRRARSAKAIFRTSASRWRLRPCRSRARRVVAFEDVQHLRDMHARGGGRRRPDDFPAAILPRIGRARPRDSREIGQVDEAAAAAMRSARRSPSGPPCSARAVRREIGVSVSA